MKHLIYFTALLIVAASCNSSRSDKPEPDDDVTVNTIEPEIHTELYGTYVGDFIAIEDENDDYIEPIKISITINYITAKGATAESAVRGNQRPMSGKMMEEGQKFVFEMDEPGDDPHDGRFEFYIKGDSLIGTWTAYDSTVKGPRKEYALVKKPFEYNANLMLPEDWEYVDWEKPKAHEEFNFNADGTIDTFVNEVYRSASPEVHEINASTKKLTEAELKNLKKLDLEIIRNTIFARHGYAFKSKHVRQFFDRVDWYVPISSDVDPHLTDLERENIDLLKKFEQYAEDNYDTFGR